MAFTFFFRDSETLDLAIRHILPTVQGQAFIHVWDAGCAHGPEPYTLGILLREQMSEIFFRNVRIHATDVEPQFRSQVTSGIYPIEELQRIPSELFQRYFRETDRPGRYQVVEEIRSRVQFTQHDLLALKPIRQDLSLIVCKNVLLHFDECQRHAVLRMFHESLRDDCLLATEHTQKLPADLNGIFTPVVANAQIHRKRIACGSAVTMASAQDQLLTDAHPNLKRGRHASKSPTGAAASTSPC